MKRCEGIVFIDPQIKSAHSLYQDQGIGIMSFQQKSSQLRTFLQIFKSISRRKENF